MKTIFTLIAIAIVFPCVGQSVKYKVLDDEPMHHKKTEIDLCIAGIDFVVPLNEFGESDVAFNANIRVNHFPIREKYGVDLNVQLAAALIAGVNYTRTNLSGTYVLSSSRSKKEQSFVLSRKSSSTGYVQTTTTKFINIPQTRQLNLEARAGLSRTTGVFGRVPIEGISEPRYIDYKSLGVSAGIQLRRFYYQKVRVNKGVYSNSNSWILYGDALIIPFTSYTPRGTGFRTTPTNQQLRDAVREAGVRTRLGAALGFKYTGNRHRLFSHTFGAELGVLAPNKSLIINTFWGLPINF